MASEEGRTVLVGMVIFRVKVLTPSKMCQTVFAEIVSCKQLHFFPQKNSLVSLSPLSLSVFTFTADFTAIRTPAVGATLRNNKDCVAV